MAKTSYFGGPNSPDLGSKPPIHKQPIPGYDQQKYKLVLTEKEKEQDNLYAIKSLVYNYERIGREQVFYLRQKILKLFNLSYGIIDKRDYVKGRSEYETEITMLDGEDLDFDLKFYPLVPNIVNTLANFLTKIKIDFTAYAVNEEAQNEILDQKNEMVKSLLINQLKEIYEFNLEQQGITPETQPDVYQKQMEIFQALPKVQDYYSTDFRLEIEQWASHRMEIDKQKHNLKALSKDLMFNKLVCDRPFIHTNLLEDDYRPEVIRPENAAYLKSPHAKDVSESTMFMWFEYDSPISIINKWGDKLKPEDIEKLQQFFLSTRFSQWTQDTYNKDVPDDLVMAQNWLAFRTEYQDKGDVKYRGDEYREHLVEIMNMYFQVPRHLQKLTMIGSDGNKVSTIVDETYKASVKPVYDGDKTEANLIFGEHLEPFYINELWRCVKLNLTRNPNPDPGQDIWVILEKYPVQISDPKISKYGSLIPVNGGPQTNEYSPSISIAGKCEPWQIFYNYLWNRNMQIAETEWGVFLMMNQNIIPTESMGEEWGRNNLLKWILTARDTGVAPIDNQLNANGQSISGLTGGYGQKIDMTRTDEILSKAKLAEICKQECLQVVGISPQLLGDISPSETATGVVQGIQKSITQLKHLYDEHFLMMEKATQTMLEVAKYLAIKKGSVEESYMSSDKQRVIFQTMTDNFPLYQLGVFCTTDFDDTLLLEELRMNILRDNTLGADALDKITIMTSNSKGEMIDKLKSLQTQRQKAEQAKSDRESMLAQQQIEAENARQEREMQFRKEMLILELNSREQQAEFRALGSTGFAQGDGLEQIAKLKSQQLKEDSFYQDILDKARTNQLKKEQLNNQMISEDKNREQTDSIEKQKIQLQREKIMAQMKDSENRLEIAKVNK